MLARTCQCLTGQHVQQGVEEQAMGTWKPRDGIGLPAAGKWGLACVALCQPVARSPGSSYLPMVCSQPQSTAWSSQSRCLFPSC